MHGAVTLHMRAEPGRVWDLVSDVTRIGSYSPETFEAEWLEGATGPQLGARFRGHVKRNGRGPVYWTECKVVSCEPGREFGFVVLLRDKPVNTWTYKMEASGDGTDVTESFRMQPTTFNRIYWAIAGKARNRTNVAGMRQTLERIRVAVESEPS